MEGGALFNSGVLGSNFLWWIGQVADDSYWRDNMMPGKFADKDSLEKNVEIEFQRNGERYSFLKWGQQAFNNFRIVPPGCLLYTSPSPRDQRGSRMPSSA